MTVTRAGQLRIGDFVRFDCQVHEIAGIDGAVVILLADSGRRVSVKSSVLLSDSTFEIVSAHRRRRPLPPAYFALLPPDLREEALWLESHISEVLDGVPAGSEPGTVPRPVYDVARTTLRQREQAKCRELAEAGRVMCLRTLQRYCHAYASQGIEGVIDKRAVRRSTLTGRVDDRYVDASRRVVAENVNWSTGSSVRLKRLVDKAVDAQHGTGVVEIPSQPTFNRLRLRLKEARHSTGSARTRQTLANQPEGPFGAITATRPGEWMQIDSTPSM
jgi:putative transposase